MTAFQLSKPYIDVGYFSNKGQALNSFYADEVSLPSGPKLALENGYDLYRFDVGGSALKVNDLATPIPQAIVNYARIAIPTRNIETRREMRDPDGNPVDLVPFGDRGVTQLGISWILPNEDAVHDFAVNTLGAVNIGGLSYQFGNTTILFEAHSDAPRANALEARGLSYVTIHVADLPTAHEHLIRNGCTEAIPPTPFRDITAYSFVRDPLGGWIEVSQRADLTGKPVDATLVGFSLEQVRQVRRQP